MSYRRYNQQNCPSSDEFESAEEVIVISSDDYTSAEECGCDHNENSFCIGRKEIEKIVEDKIEKSFNQSFGSPCRNASKNLERSRSTQEIHDKIPKHIKKIVDDIIDEKFKKVFPMIPYQTKFNPSQCRNDRRESRFVTHTHEFDTKEVAEGLKNDEERDFYWKILPTALKEQFSKASNLISSEDEDEDEEEDDMMRLKVPKFLAPKTPQNQPIRETISSKPKKMFDGKTRPQLQSLRFPIKNNQNSSNLQSPGPSRPKKSIWDGYEDLINF